MPAGRRSVPGTAAWRTSHLMTPDNAVAPLARQCLHCPHSLDEHQLVLVVPNLPGGIILCPAGCTCLATWSAGPSRSTPAQRVHVRDQVSAALRSAGHLTLAECVRRL